MLRPEELNQRLMEHRLIYAIGFLRGEEEVNPHTYSTREVLEILEKIAKDHLG